MSLKLIETDGIRRFSDANLQRAIERTLASLPEGHKLAAVAHADVDGASVSLLVRMGDSWSVAAAAYKPFHGALTAEAEVRWSPF